MCFFTESVTELSLTMGLLSEGTTELLGELAHTGFGLRGLSAYLPGEPGLWDNFAITG